MISYPRRIAGGRTLLHQARTVDIVPTILELAGLEVTPGLDGTSLLPWLEGTPGEAGSDLPAWSYAGWPNRGLALRDRARSYLVNDALWPALCGREEYYRLDEDPAQLSDLAATAPEVEELRRQASQYLRRHATGLILSVANREPAPLSVTFSGSRFLPCTLKRIDGLCPAADGQEEGSIRVHLAPGTGSTLVWQSAAGGNPRGERLEVALGLAGSDAAGGSFRVDDPASFREPRAFRLEPGASGQGTWRWREGRGQTPGIGVTVHWRPGRARPLENEATSAHRRQLEALGYVR